MEEKVMNTPLVSILMPVYNAESYLKDALDSILNQSYQNFELIVINDGSVDRSVKILNSTSDSRLRILTNSQNRGLVFTLNRGLAEVRGKYIARMDSDDIAHPNRLRFQVKELEEFNETIVCGTAFQPFHSHDEKNIVILSNNNLLSLLDSIICHPSALIRSDFIRLNGLNYSTVIEDFDLWSKIFQINNFNPNTFRNLNKSLLRYRIHSEQYTSRKKDSIIAAGIDLRRKNLIRFLATYDIEYKFSDSSRFLLKDFNRMLVKIEKLEKKLPFPKNDIQEFIQKLMFYMVTSLDHGDVTIKTLSRYVSFTNIDVSFYKKVLMRKVFKRYYRRRF